MNKAPVDYGDTMAIADFLCFAAATYCPPMSLAAALISLRYVSCRALYYAMLRCRRRYG